MGQTLYLTSYLSWLPITAYILGLLLAFTSVYLIIKFPRKFLYYTVLLINSFVLIGYFFINVNPPVTTRVIEESKRASTTIIANHSSHFITHPAFYTVIGTVLFVLSTSLLLDYAIDESNILAGVLGGLTLFVLLPMFIFGAFKTGTGSVIDQINDMVKEQTNKEIISEIKSSDTPVTNYIFVDGTECSTRILTIGEQEISKNPGPMNSNGVFSFSTTCF